MARVNQHISATSYKIHGKGSKHVFNYHFSLYPADYPFSIETYDTVRLYTTIQIKRVSIRACFFFKLDGWWTLRFVLLLFHDTNSCSCVVVLRCGISEYYTHSQTLCSVCALWLISLMMMALAMTSLGSCVKPPSWGDASFGKHLMSLSHESRSSVNVFPVPFVHTHCNIWAELLFTMKHHMNHAISFLGIWQCTSYHGDFYAKRAL